MYEEQRKHHLAISHSAIEQNSLREWKFRVRLSGIGSPAKKLEATGKYIFL